MRVLAGDIGGTKTRLSLFEVEGDSFLEVAGKTFASNEFAALEEVIEAFLSSGDAQCSAACFGIAGPVFGRRTQTTNLAWAEVDADVLEKRAKIPKVSLLNDLEATAWGLPLIDSTRRLILNPGREDAGGNAAVIAAGTGLGEAGLYWDGEQHWPFACEGGHASFSPTDDLSNDLLRFLRRKFEHVSWERVVSGTALPDLFRFLLERGGYPTPSWFAEAEESGDPAAAVSDAGLEGQCEVSSETLGLFARLYGEEAGNLALKIMATGGVWLGGGIAPKIRSVLSDGSFMKGFIAKGRRRPLLEAMPVTVILDDRAALMGAARCASDLMIASG